MKTILIDPSALEGNLGDMANDLIHLCDEELRRGTSVNLILPESLPPVVMQAVAINVERLREHRPVPEGAELCFS